LDFEKPILELEKKIKDMKDFAAGEKMEISSEIKVWERKLEKLQKDVYSKLTAWQKVQLARHPLRPQTSDYISLLFSI